jgi:hypothetical protein
MTPHETPRRQWPSFPAARRMARMPGMPHPTVRAGKRPLQTRVFRAVGHCRMEDRRQ